jgi:hypothetical protein
MTTLTLHATGDKAHLRAARLPRARRDPGNADCAKARSEPGTWLPTCAPTADLSRKLAMAILVTEPSKASRKRLHRSPKRQSSSSLTLPWREMDSNFWYRGRKARDFQNIPEAAGTAGVRYG